MFAKLGNMSFVRGLKSQIDGYNNFKLFMRSIDSFGNFHLNTESVPEDLYKLIEGARGV